MGATPIRITADDFVIPPGLGTWPLATDGAGRIGGVRLGLAAAWGSTRLTSCYQQVPLRVLPPFQMGSERATLCYLLNPTAGLMEGDGQLVELHAASAVHAVVVGQSSTRIHPSALGLSTQQWRVQVDRGAVVVILPGPAIPFRGSRYYQRVEVDLAEGASVLWGDVWLAGRYARGSVSERFQFARLRQDFVVRREGRRVFRDHFDWQGPWDAATASWHFGDAVACGSLFATGRLPADATPLTGLAEGGAWTTAAGDTCYRWEGSSEAVIASVVQTALLLAARLANGPDSRPWFADHDMAPCHWFSAAPGQDDRGEGTKNFKPNPRVSIVEPPRPGLSP